MGIITGFSRTYSVGWRALIAGGVALSLAACASIRGETSDSVSLGPGDLVRLVPQESSSLPNDHPVRFSAEQLRVALGALRMQADESLLLSDSWLGKKDDDRTVQVFTEQDLEQASEALERAFARASPRQDVALRLSQLRSSKLIGVLHASRVTAARLFHRDGRLHVILGTVDLDPERAAALKGGGNPKGSSYAGIDNALNFDTEIGSRGQPRRIDWKPLLPSGARFHSDRRNDWIELDPEAILAAATASPPSRAARPVVAPSAGARSAAPDAASIEQRLRQLRSFHEKGLISEDLYREKVRELVEGYLVQPAQ